MLYKYGHPYKVRRWSEKVFVRINSFKYQNVIKVVLWLEYNIGDKVMLKDDGQIYKVVGVRTEDRIVLFDLEKGDERASVEAYSVKESDRGAKSL